MTSLSVRIHSDLHRPLARDTTAPIRSYSASSPATAAWSMAARVVGDGVPESRIRPLYPLEAIHSWGALGSGHLPSFIRPSVTTTHTLSDSAWRSPWCLRIRESVCRRLCGATNDLRRKRKI